MAQYSVDSYESVPAKKICVHIGGLSPTISGLFFVLLISDDTLKPPTPDLFGLNRNMTDISG